MNLEKLVLGTAMLLAMMVLPAKVSAHPLWGSSQPTFGSEYSKYSMGDSDQELQESESKHNLLNEKKWILSFIHQKADQDDTLKQAYMSNPTLKAIYWGRPINNRDIIYYALLAFHRGGKAGDNVSVDSVHGFETFLTYVSRRYKNLNTNKYILKDNEFKGEIRLIYEFFVPIMRHLEDSRQ